MAPSTRNAPPTDVDVLVVGAGLSGIAAGYHLQDKCPNKSYAILEMRDRMGGTWDLFRYPGVRSDSDMHTLGYGFRPWTDSVALADGPSILKYIEETAAEFGIDEHIHYQQKVEAARWSSETATWTVSVRNTATDTVTEVRSRFLFLCSGYYDYDQGYTPEFEGREDFEGEIVHPQFWGDDVDYAGKKVIVIGSGATAVTLVPAMTDQASHVTMLQRSPTYVLSIPGDDPIAALLRRRLPGRFADPAIRWKNIFFAIGFYKWARRFPERARKWILKNVEAALDGATDLDPHFTPTYDPWDQRLCFVPDSDLFEAIKAGKASVVTDHIERFTKKGIRLESGAELEADMIVTATGLKLKMMGGMAFDIDGRSVKPSDVTMYKGTMLSDVPNFGFAIGYTNASWTLKCDLCCAYFCRLINHLDAHGYTHATPRVPTDLGEESALPLDSGYINRARDILPRQGDRAPWKLYQNYALDRAWLRHAPLRDSALELARAPRPGARPTPAAERESARP